MKLSKVICIGLGFISLSASAELREHGAHKHGAAEMSIAFDGMVGQIDFAAPGDSIYGFEYQPKKAADKKKQQDGLDTIEKNISEIVQFDASLKCVISKKKVEVEQHKGESHSQVDAEFSVTCSKSPIGTVIVFHIQKFFPKLKDVDVKVIADDLQKSFEAQKDGAKLELKK